MSGNRWNHVELHVLHVLQALWVQGFTASEIAKEIPSKSREAICGKLFRLRASGTPTRLKRALDHSKRRRGAIGAQATRKARAA